MDEASTVEAEFAARVQEFYHGQSDPIQLVVAFKALCAVKALLAAANLEESGAKSSYIQEEFENWDLETKLWHLVEVLYLYRLAEDEEVIAETQYSSVSVLQENVLRQNRKLKELLIILGWLQTNSRGVDVPESLLNTPKWSKTRQALANRDLNVLTHHGHQGETDTKLQNIDPDAPIRQACPVAAEDDHHDSQVFRTIYQLILSGQLQEAIDLASGSGNHTLALILLGGTQDFIDPVLDKNLCESTMTDIVVPNKPSGAKHKLLWKQAVYKLSQQLGINRYERLIYDYLSGGDISGGLEVVGDSWESLLIIYLNKICLHVLLSALDSSESTTSIPAPPVESIDQVLNLISKGSNEAAQQSKHPLRIVMGSVMISEIGALVSGVLKSLNNNSTTQKVWEEDYLVRVMAHLGLFAHAVGSQISANDLTQLLTLYVQRLSARGFTDLVPLYLSFIPDDSDAREYYSKFLSSITDPSERTKQLQLVRKLGVDSNGDEERMANVLRRTVERVMADTEAEYRPSGEVTVQDEDTDVTETDTKICQSVDWFYENNMYPDALSASLTVIRRFLACGRLSALRHFVRGKDLKQLVKNYDVDLYTRSLAGLDDGSQVGDADKDEIVQYYSFVQGLELIQDWRKFLKDNQTNSLSAVFWKSKHLESLIEKVSSGIVGLIRDWFQELIATDGPNKEMYQQLRVLYVPYLVMELLDIYQQARMSNWLYVKKAFELVSLVADEDNNDLLACFVNCGRLDELMVRSGALAAVACERGIANIFS